MHYSALRAYFGSIVGSCCDTHRARPEGRREALRERLLEDINAEGWSSINALAERIEIALLWVGGPCSRAALSNHLVFADIQSLDLRPGSPGVLESSGDWLRGVKDLSSLVDLRIRVDVAPPLQVLRQIFKSSQSSLRSLELHSSRMTQLATGTVGCFQFIGDNITSLSLSLYLAPRQSSTFMIGWPSIAGQHPSITQLLPLFKNLHYLSIDTSEPDYLLQVLDRIPSSSALFLFSVTFSKSETLARFSFSLDDSVTPSDGS